MRLINKRTGEIAKLEGGVIQRNNLPDYILDSYNSLAELSEEWEDYHEETKEYWYITDIGCTGRETEGKQVGTRKSIGNYFETKEEAEKAVGKLKAWKRLRDNGFKFKAYQLQELKNKFWIDHGYTEIEDDLGLLFGGEE